MAGSLTSEALHLNLQLFTVHTIFKSRHKFRLSRLVRFPSNVDKFPDELIVVGLELCAEAFVVTVAVSTFRSEFIELLENMYQGFPVIIRQQII